MKMYEEKIPVTLDNLQAKLEERVMTRQSGWKWCRSTLYKFLTTKMGYSYTNQRSHYKNLREDVTIANQRIQYIKSVQKYRKEG